MKAFGIILLVALIAGCTGKSRRGEDDDDTTIRSGDDVPIENQKYYDAKPSISADGQNIVFVSGRDKQLKIYTFSDGDDEPARLTDDGDGLDDEFEVAVSPDGTLVGLIGSKDGAINIHFKSFDGSGELETLDDDDNGIESKLSFSDDGALITFVKISSSEVGATVYVGEVDGAGNVSNLTSFSDDSYIEDNPRFVPTGTAGTYSLVTQRQSTAEFSQELWVRTISTGSGVSVDAEEQLTSARPLVRDTFIGGGLNTLYYSTSKADSGNFDNDKWEPEGDVETDEEVTVQAVLAGLAIEEDSIEKISNDLGVKVLGASASGVAGGVVVALTRDVWSCKKDKLSYVTRLKIIDPSDESVEAFTPYYEEGSDFSENAETICVSKPEKVDTSIKYVTVNGNGTPSSFSAAYVSLFSKSDNEVRLVTFDGTDFTVTDVSQNPGK